MRMRVVSTHRVPKGTSGAVVASCVGCGARHRNIAPSLRRRRGGSAASASGAVAVAIIIRIRRACVRVAVTPPVRGTANNGTAQMKRRRGPPAWRLHIHNCWPSTACNSTRARQRRGKERRSVGLLLLQKTPSSAIVGWKHECSQARPQCSPFRLCSVLCYLLRKGRLERCLPLWAEGSPLAGVSGCPIGAAARKRIFAPKPPSLRAG